MTGSGKKGLLQSVIPAVNANYVFAFVGDTRRRGDEVSERVNIVENQPESSMADDQVDGERAMARLYASPNSRRHMAEETIKVVTRGAARMVIVREFNRRVRVRAFVMGAVNDERTKVLLDNRVNISVISESFARELKLKDHMSTDTQIGVEGIGRSKVVTTSRTLSAVVKNRLLNEHPAEDQENAKLLWRMWRILSSVCITSL